MEYSNSMIERFFLSLRHQWLYFHHLDNISSLRKLVAKYVHEHNEVIPHSAFMGQTPSEVYSGQASDLPEHLSQKIKEAMKKRIEANRKMACEDCVVKGKDVPYS